MPTHQAPWEHKSSLRGGNADEAIQNGMKRPAIYIMTNKRNGTLYTGVTSNLVKRVYEHKNGVVPGFQKNMSEYYCEETKESRIPLQGMKANEGISQTWIAAPLRGSR